MQAALHPAALGEAAEEPVITGYDLVKEQLRFGHLAVARLGASLDGRQTGLGSSLV